MSNNKETRLLVAYRVNTSVIYIYIYFMYFLNHYFYILKKPDFFVTYRVNISVIYFMYFF